ncbi:MAG: glycosyltransferase family 1 protein [Deltaproteobacteria bacterium]|nr:MAG: glycosyltransferase family 1 protein [Deltaproteobacteria bacterium]
MKILLLSRYGSLGASSRVRSYQYLPYLNTQGIKVTVAPFLGDDYLKTLYAGEHVNLRYVLRSYIGRILHLLKSKRFDMLWVEYEVLPWLPAYGEEILHYLKILWIADFDDAVFYRYDMHPEAVVRVLLGRKIDSVMQHASLVLVGNTYLAERARRAGAERIEYLPSVIDLERYETGNWKLETRNSKFTIGWIGSPSTAQYLHIAGPALASVCREINARLVLVGSGEIQIRGVQIEIRSWSEDTEVGDILGFDVGIMPMPDNPWTRGKCGYKLIQYMACGLPVIASPVGVNQVLVENGVNGFLATDTESWVRAFLTLYENCHLRERMGRCGRIKVETEYCLQVTAPRLASFIRSFGKIKT